MKNVGSGRHRCRRISDAKKKEMERGTEVTGVDGEKKKRGTISLTVSLFCRRVLSGSLVTHAIERTKRFHGHDWLV